MIHETLPFGTMGDGRKVSLHLITNGRGMQVGVSNLGASLVSVRVPDAHGGFPDVSLGFDGATGYLDNINCFGAIVGRNANRIAGATFDLKGTTVRLSPNMGADNIHSGPHVYNERLWKTDRADDSSVTFNLHSRRGDQGFPGAVDVNVTYSLSEDDELRIRYVATPDDTTLINLTSHAYWNLNGHASGSALRHVLQVEAGSYTPLDSNMIPTGEIAPVEGTPYDLRKPTVIQDAVAALPGGIDMNYVLENGERLERACTLVGDRSGIAMDVLTDSPGLQVFTAGGLDAWGKDGAHYGHSAGIALETQFFPDHIHHENFPQPVYDAGHAFRFTTAYQFRTQA